MALFSLTFNLFTPPDGPSPDAPEVAPFHPSLQFPTQLVGNSQSLPYFCSIIHCYLSHDPGI